AFLAYRQALGYLNAVWTKRPKTRCRRKCPRRHGRAFDSVMINEEIAKCSGKPNAGIIAFVLTGNPRAERLAPKDILVEFRWLRDRAIALCTFGDLLRNAWVSDGPLPDTPKLPTREDQKNRPKRTADFRHNLGSAR